MIKGIHCRITKLSPSEYAVVSQQLESRECEAAGVVGGGSKKVHIGVCAPSIPFSTLPARAPISALDLQRSPDLATAPFHHS